MSKYERLNDHRRNLRILGSVNNCYVNFFLKILFVVVYLMNAKFTYVYLWEKNIGLEKTMKVRNLMRFALANLIFRAAATLLVFLE